MSIRLGIIGYGYWGPNLLRNFAVNSEFEVVALAERHEAARSRAARTDLACSPSKMRRTCWRCPNWMRWWSQRQWRRISRWLARRC